MSSIGDWLVTIRESYNEKGHGVSTFEDLDEAKAWCDRAYKDGETLGIEWAENDDGSWTGLWGTRHTFDDGEEIFSLHNEYTLSRIPPMPEGESEIITHRVGYVDVDAGIVQVGDPCYTLTKNRGESSGRTRQVSKAGLQAVITLLRSEAAGKTSDEDIEKLLDPGSIDAEREGVLYDDMIHHLFERGENESKYLVAPEGYTGAWMPYTREVEGFAHEGAGVVVSSGFGDGSYPVTVELYNRHHPDLWLRSRVKSVRVDFISDGEDDDDTDE